MGILGGNPKEEPMHYGEVFGTWTFLMSSQSLVAGYQTLYNHTGDGDLKKIIKEAIDDCQDAITKVEALLKENGVGLPPAPPERPEAQLDDVPVGARFQDKEIAAMVAKDNAAGLVACSKIMGESIREDIATMFGEIHTKKATLGAKILRLNKEKGWLIAPPLHQQPSEND
ncbi:DUF3231 family protein [Oceanobacillus halotolerans]|uniref:DUF3231 family protein n=1 Tax=Oceanobacillus halotolerans TaxID=2663380 RepID=UPI0013D9F3BA|nr:DUF3231 family protein [Oceanobacillus halotolerans]